MACLRNLGMERIGLLALVGITSDMYGPPRDCKGKASER